MIKNIIFDFDGVIVESENYWIKLKLLALKKSNLKYETLLNKSKLFGLTSEDFLGKVFKKKLKKEERLIFQKNYNDLKKKNKNFIPKLNKKIEKIIKSEKYNVGIVSNNNKEYIVRVLKYYKIYKYFKNLIISYKDLNSKKPSPIGYKKFLKNNKLKVNDVVVIEDSIHGIFAAKKAGIRKTILYKKKNFKEKDLLKF